MGSPNNGILLWTIPACVLLTNPYWFHSLGDSVTGVVIVNCGMLKNPLGGFAEGKQSVAEPASEERAA